MPWLIRIRIVLLLLLLSARRIMRICLPMGAIVSITRIGRGVGRGIPFPLFWRRHLRMMRVLLMIAVARRIVGVLAMMVIRRRRVSTTRILVMIRIRWRLVGFYFCSVLVLSLPLILLWQL